jgi:calcineurin-like phosphoesterase family protein
MDEIIIKNWNELVKPKDTVFHLGDFGDPTILQYLNGNIYLLVGNYERQNKEGFIDKYFDKFKEIIELDILLYTYKINNKNYHFNLVHEPSNMNFNHFNLFGHVHQLSMVKKYIKSYGDKEYIYHGLNVGTDCHYFKPINLEKILFYKNAIEKHYDEEVFL